jgi:hypothetical protein
MDHLGAVLTDLLAREPTDIVGRTFSAVTFRPSGQDLLNVFTRVNEDTPATLVAHTPQDLKRLLQDTQGISAFMGVYLRHWDRGDLEFPETIPAPDEISLEAELRKIYSL